MKVFWKSVTPYKKWRLHYVDRFGEHSSMTSIEISPYFQLYIPDNEYTANVPNDILKRKLNLDPYEEVYDTRVTGNKARQLAAKWKRRVKNEIEEYHNPTKNWKTENHFGASKTELYFWRNKRNRGFISIDKVEELAPAREYGKYILSINTPEHLETKYFNSKEKAKKFAKDYMKKSN